MNPKLRILTTLLFCLLGLSVTALGLWVFYVALAGAVDVATRTTEHITQEFGKGLGTGMKRSVELVRLLAECTVRLFAWFLRLFLWWA